MFAQSQCRGRECIWRSTSSPAKKALEGLHRTSQDQETISQFHKDACYRSCTYQALPLTPNFVLQQVDSAPTCTVCCVLTGALCTKTAGRQAGNCHGGHDSRFSVLREEWMSTLVFGELTERSASYKCKC
eukprot:1157841-Pelagomonas_calceolata.AAC.9